MEDGRWKMEEPSAISHQPSDIENTWMVKRPQDKEPWPITVGQLVALTERLVWIDDEKASKLIFRFPYMEMTLAQGSKPLTTNREPLTVVGPPPLLDGYTWKEYRWLTDWMPVASANSPTTN